MREIFNKVKIISILANNISVFRQVAFFLAIVINILVLFSYKYYDKSPEAIAENRGNKYIKIIDKLIKLPQIN